MLHEAVVKKLKVSNNHFNVFIILHLKAFCHCDTMCLHDYMWNFQFASWRNNFQFSIFNFNEWEA